MPPIISNALTPRVKLFMFSVYSFFENIMWFILEFFPQFLRQLIFKILFDAFDSSSMIDYKTYFRYPWKISIGCGVWINRGCEFYPSMLAGNAKITIGNYCALGPRVRVLSATHSYRKLNLPDEAASVHIGHHVWIGAGATILPGVSIGNGAIVGAASVVTKDVAPYTIVVGNPARFLKIRDLDDENTIQ